MTFFKNFFNKPKTIPVQPDEGLAIYFHEDMYCQVELVPRENMLHLQGEIEAIEKFAAENFDGQGYTDLYERKGDPVAISQSKISVGEMDKCLLHNGFAKADTVYYGYGAERIKAESTHAYRFYKCDVFVEHKSDIVTALWIDGFRFQTVDAITDNLKDTLLDIGNKYNLILNDWDQTITVGLSKESEIENYLNENISQYF